MNDLISRQAAIDALGEQGLITAMVVVDRLPPVQPVLTCKGCKYDGYYKHMRCRNCLRKERDLYEPE